MLHHISLPVADLSASKAMYEPALAALGYRVVAGSADFSGSVSPMVRTAWRWSCNAPHLRQDRGSTWPLPPQAARRLTNSTRRPWPMAGATTARRDCGLQYEPTYYAAFVIDPDGHRIEAVHK